MSDPTHFWVQQRQVGVLGGNSVATEKENPGLSLLNFTQNSGSNLQRPSPHRWDGVELYQHHSELETPLPPSAECPQEPGSPAASRLVFSRLSLLQHSSTSPRKIQNTVNQGCWKLVLKHPVFGIMLKILCSSAWHSRPCTSRAWASSSS